MTPATPEQPAGHDEPDRLDALPDPVRRWLGREHPVTVEIDDEGALRTVSLPRWGDPDGQGYREVPFGVSFGDPTRHDGIAVPMTLTAGWWWGEPDWTDRTFFRATVDDVAWR